MPVLTIKAKSGGEDPSRLVAVANRKATEVGAKSDRVLIVYDKQTASIYYETRPDRRTPPRGRAAERAGWP